MNLNRIAQAIETVRGSGGRYVTIGGMMQSTSLPGSG